MKKIGVVDCETDPFLKGRIPAPFIWGFYDGVTYEEFETCIDLIAFLEDKPIIVYAHNGGKFDWHFILDFIEVFEPIKIINGRIAKFKIGECEFRDSYNILPTSLATFNKQEFDYSLLEVKNRNIPENKKRIRDYLYSDCINLYNYVSAFIERFGLSLTQAGAAMKQWEKISGLKPPNDLGGYMYENFKKFYYGGRCEVFEYGIIKDEFTMVDIRSAYPFAMLNDHPLYTDTLEITGSEWSELKDKEKGPTLITLDAVSYGALPYRENNSLFFPSDNVRRTYHVTGWELMAAIDTNTICDIDIKIVYYFPQKTNFSGYINHFYNERKNAKAIGDKAGDIFCKLLMNSLYGKFGSNPLEYRNYKTVLPEWLDENGCAGEWGYAGPFGSIALVEKELEENEQRFYNVCTAASITGFGRAYLWRGICACKGVLYCDTDSIAARNIGNLPSGIGNELGQWEIEGEFSSAAFAGRKLYSMIVKNADEFTLKKEGNIKASELRKMASKKYKPSYKVACKGVDLTPNLIKKVAEGNEVLYEPDAPVFSIHKNPHFINRRVKMVKKVLQN